MVLIKTSAHQSIVFKCTYMEIISSIKMHCSGANCCPIRPLSRAYRCARVLYNSAWSAASAPADTPCTGI